MLPMLLATIENDVAALDVSRLLRTNASGRKFWQVGKNR